MMTVTFEAKASVRQGCVMSTVLFNLVDRIMRRTTEDKVRDIAKVRMCDGFCYIVWDMNRHKLVRKRKQVALTDIKKYRVEYSTRRFLYYNTHLQK